MDIRWKVRYDSYLYEHETIKAELIDEINKILGFTYAQEQSYLKGFEKLFAKFCKTRFSIGTSSGTSALQLSLAALGVGEGDEVILQPNGYIATALAISSVGAKPVFVDVDEHSSNISAEKIENAITDKAKAIIPVHLYGQMTDMKPIRRIASQYGLMIIEDAAHAHGSTYHGESAGSIGDVACYSFHQSKNLGGYGNGGIVVTQKKNVAENIRVLRDPDIDTPFLLKSKRTPAFLGAMQVALVKTKLKYFDSWTKRRRQIAETYKDFIRSKHVVLPKEDTNCFHTYRDFPILCKRRNVVRYRLLARRIETRIHYPVPVHLTKVYKHLGYKKNDFPAAEKLCQTVLSLPVHPFLNEKDIGYVIKTINRF